MQMAKVAVAVEALHKAKLPFIAGTVSSTAHCWYTYIQLSLSNFTFIEHPHLMSNNSDTWSHSLESSPYTSPNTVVLNDPTYGGVSASYAMQADIRIAMSDARIGTHNTHETTHIGHWDIGHSHNTHIFTCNSFTLTLAHQHTLMKHNCEQLFRNTLSFESTLTHTHYTNTRTHTTHSYIKLNTHTDPCPIISIVILH